MGLVTFLISQLTLFLCDCNRQNNYSRKYLLQLVILQLSLKTTMRGYDNEKDVSIPYFVGFKSTFSILLLFVLLLSSLLSFTLRHLFFSFFMIIPI